MFACPERPRDQLSAQSVPAFKFYHGELALRRRCPCGRWTLGRLKRMGMFIVIVFLALSSWALVALFRQLRRQRATAGRWLAFGILVACGVSIGIWCALYVEYNVGTRYRIGSFPIPVVFFHLEDGAWMDFPVPEFQVWATIFANIITITALATLPLWLVSWPSRRHEHTTT